ncbi:MAG TPA: spore germination protein [Patescibacteria group bacterium]|nr:spore germination protein [Patescibacteria group bacterium]
MQNLLSKKLEDNMFILNEKFLECPDIKKQRVLLKDGTPAVIIYVEGLTSIDLLQRDIIPNLLRLESAQVFDENMQTVRLPVASLSLLNEIEALISDILNGKTAVFINGYDIAISLSVIKVEKRNISEPTIEKNVKGAQEAFVESINTNISILRRKVKNNRLKIRLLTLGDLTNQTVALVYIEGIANPEIVETMYNKIKDIQYDGIFDVGYIEQLIADNQITPFPHYLYSERPDKTVSCLLEGKLAVLVDGSPFAMLAPMSFFSAFQALDDYSTSWPVGSLTRLLRMLALLMALFLPALYIAIVSYHYYMIPLNLLIPLAESRARVPFPPIIEVLILETTLEMLREATIRLPTFIATSLGVVGGLIIGQAAVDAGIVSNIIIIVVAVTAIASFLIPNHDMALTIRYTRFIVMLFAAIFGIIGVVICGVFLLSHLIVLESMGEPYFKPVFPFNRNDFKDIMLRPSLKRLRKRPTLAHPLDKTRGKTNDKQSK